MLCAWIFISVWHWREQKAAQKKMIYFLFRGLSSIQLNSRDSLQRLSLRGGGTNFRTLVSSTALRCLAFRLLIFTVKRIGLKNDYLKRPQPFKEMWWNGSLSLYEINKPCKNWPKIDFEKRQPTHRLCITIDVFKMCVETLWKLLMGLFEFKLCNLM